MRMMPHAIEIGWRATLRRHPMRMILVHLACATIGPVVGERTIDGFKALTLAGPGGLEAAFVPDAGMVGCSLRHHSEELLGLRGGLRGYVAERKTMGIPLLYPWANRLGRTRFPVAGREVDIESVSPPLRLDGNGLPMHGLLAGLDGWRVRHHEATADGAVLAATLRFGAADGLTEAFPFPHVLGFEAALAGATLTIATTVEAPGDGPVPIAFGYHPYLRLPGVERAAWDVEVPVREALVLDERMLPTGARVAVQVPAGPLGERTFDDAYVAPPGAAPFALSGGGRRIELAFLSGYPFAQVFAPAEDDVVAYEPMTAPTNALVDGGDALPLLAAGERFSAAFSITVTEVAG
jgi:aldose 1-epimerase